MSEFKGTPGPWFIADDALGNMTHIVLSKQYPFEMMSEENLALITAAPELLESLQDFMAESAGNAKSCSHDFECICRFDKARAAIAKALGK
ncbi:hypothetical protein [Citrobacter freundii]|uniref:hypothetical protein n=1 Tax=Citrobacter freundii TaxID=546 RepID=UPI00122FB8D0|nr:hypothetical protein [Citrobacter freundii]KAA3569936.1 hypothetical protein D1173_10520 [Citrobacter freundii]